MRSTFGATKHRYKIGPPASPSLVLDYEAICKISLPNEYAAFLNFVGLAPRSKDMWSVMAGPYYGVWTLPGLTDEIISGLNLSPAFSSSTTASEWREFAARFDAIYSNSRWEADNSEKQKFMKLEIEYDKGLHNGLLPLCSLGCCLSANLVLVGKDKGTVVYLDDDSPTPWMFTGLRFLDWYEAWLDDVLSGGLECKFPTYDL